MIEWFVAPSVILGTILAVFYLDRLRRYSRTFKLKDNLFSCMYCFLIANGFVGGSLLLISAVYVPLRSTVAGLGLYIGIGGFCTMVIAAHTFYDNIYKPSGEKKLRKTKQSVPTTSSSPNDEKQLGQSH